MRVLCILTIILLFASCGQQRNTEAPSVQAQDSLPLLERLAHAHGFEHWPSVSEIRFTWNIDRDTTHFERTWIWDVRNQRVTRIMMGDTISYLRSEVDSTLAQVDGGFINDKYWMLAHYQWVWDQESITHTFTPGVTAPLSGKPADKLTVVYGDTGGYTPGDAYDYWLGPDSLVMEWAFRRGNQDEPNLINTWEDYQEVGGLKIAMMRQNADGTFKLYFTGVEVR